MYFQSEDTSFENQLNLNDQNFKIAFSFEKLLEKKLVNDPRYVRWIFRYDEFRQNEWYERILPYHECTDEDYAQFHPMNFGSEDEFRNIRDNPDRGFFCLDWDDEDPFQIFGNSEFSSNYKVLEAILAPCNYLHKEIDPKGVYSIGEECNTDPEEQFKYLSSSLEMRILYNRERFDPVEYGGDKIIRESALSTQQFNPRDPSYMFHNIQIQETEDETDFIQFGQTDQIDYLQLNLGQFSPSSWRDNLIENPDGQYKFGSIHLQVDL